ncbi:MAG: type IV pilus modification protein PilV [Ramlibacter sp.]|nr:type IV pilus modification protein PilV [Ramlibacter sp.]
MRTSSSRQFGASLLEVLVAILILSFGMLALSGMLAFAVQMPKLSAYRAAATALAASHIERMRANTAGFALDSYKQTMTFNATLATVAPCTYPTCVPDTIATLDKDQTGQAIRVQLPGQAGMRVTCNGACAGLDGDIWIIWQEPTTFAALEAATSDECPNPADAPTFPAFSTPQPRCLHVRFKL